MAERSLACYLTPDGERKLAVPSYYCTFDFAAMEREVAPSRSVVLARGGRSADFHALRSSTFCASGGGSALSLLRAVLAWQTLPAIPTVIQHKILLRSPCGKVCVMNGRKYTGTPFAAEAVEARTQSHPTHSSLCRSSCSSRQSTSSRFPSSDPRFK